MCCIHQHGWWQGLTCSASRSEPKGVPDWRAVRPVYLVSGAESYCACSVHSQWCRDGGVTCAACGATADLIPQPSASVHGPFGAVSWTLASCSTSQQSAESLLSLLSKAEPQMHMCRGCIRRRRDGAQQHLNLATHRAAVAVLASATAHAGRLEGQKVLLLQLESYYNLKEYPKERAAAE